MKNRILFLFLLLLSSFILSSSAQTLPAKHVQLDSPAISPSDWPSTIRSTRMTSGAATNETGLTDLIRSTARGLENDPLKIFEFVVNEIAWTPVFGLQKNAEATLLARGGSDLDMCALLIALLKAADSSSDAHYVAGDVLYPASYLGEQLGVDDDQVVSCLNRFGIPAEEYLSEDYVFMQRFWVEVTIDSTTHWLDPIFKSLNEVPSIDWQTAMNYSRTSWVANVLSDATETTSSLNNINTTNLTTSLTGLATNLMAYFRTNYPNQAMEDILGLHKIVRQKYSDWPDEELPGALGYSLDTEYTSLPSHLMATFRIQYNGIDETFYTYEIAGKRISLFHTGTSYAPHLKVNSSTLATGSATTVGSSYTLTLSVTMPTSSGLTNTFSLKGGYSYVVLHDFNEVSPQLIAEHSQQITRDRLAGATNGSEKVLGGSLSVMALTQLLHEHWMDQMLDKITGDVSVRFYEAGIMAQETGYYVDIKLAYYATHNQSGDSAKERAWLKAESLLGSAQEHGTLEQTQGSDNPGISTVKIISLNNDNDQAIYYATTWTWYGASGIRTQLQNYSASDLSSLDSYITAGQTLIVPRQGNISISGGSWTGAGFVAYSTNQVGMVISGNYKGGYSANDGNVNYQALQTKTQPAYTPPPKATVLATTSRDPVDMNRGSFLVENTDLVLGDGTLPRGLALERYYDSDQVLNQNSLGYGWTHSYDIRATQHSHAEPALGHRDPLESAASIVYAAVVADLFENDTDLRAWTLGALAAKWTMDELTDNAVTVQLGDRSLEFIQLPDGSFNPPPGSTASLEYREPISYGYASTYAVAGDYDGDGETDYGVYDPSLDKFYIAQSTDGQLEQQYGFGSTYPAPGDYDGDGQTDIAVIDPSTWKWYIHKSSTSLTITQQFGYAGVTNIQADYDGDGDTDIAVYHPTIYTWYLGSYTTTTFGAAGYKAVPADYDGDGKADIAAINTNTWTWYIKYSSSGSIRTQQYGFAGCDAVPADYDGDGKADISVFSSSYDIHFVLGSEFTNNFTIHTATGGSYRVTGDFDGDGDDELAIYVPSAGKWYIEGQNDGTYKLTERFDTVMEFDANNKICLWQNADGQAMRFYYNTYTNLILASDDYGRTLTFTYTGNTQLTAVADSSGRSVSYTYSSGNLATYTDPESKTWTYTYDTNRWITSMRDPLSQMTISNIYDGIGCVATQINGSGHVYDFYITKNYRAVEQDEEAGQTIYTFDDEGRQLSKIDALGNTSYTYYDGQGQVTNQIDPRGFSVSYIYDSNHNLLSVSSVLSVVNYSYNSENHLIEKVDELGNTTSFGYDTEHHLTAVTNALGHVTTYDYTDDGLVEQMDNGQQTTDYSYDNYGTPSTITRTDGGTETLVYNARGDLTSRTDPNTNTTSFTYDKRRLVTSETDALGYSISNIYDSAGNVVTNIDRNGNILVTRYTPTYKVSSVQYPDGSIVSNQYDNRDYLVSVTDGRGNVTSNEYDAAGRITVHRNSLNNTETFYYDENGNVTNHVNPVNHVKKYSYDFLNRLVSVVDPEGNVTSNEYDDASRLTATIDAAGKRTEYEYDALGRRTRILRPDGQDEEFEYDALGNLTAFQNAKNSRWIFGYDGMNRKTSETNALGYVTSYSYDNAGNLLSRVNANGTVISYSYDVRNLLTNKNYSGENCVYSYDPNGNLLSVSSASSAGTYAYDSLNRPTQTISSVLSVTSVVQNIFDLNGNRTGLKYPGSLQLGFAFDAANRLTNLTDWASHSTIFDYDEANRLETINYANSINASFELDGNDRVTGYSYGGSSNFIDRSIARNALGFKTAETITAGLEPTPPSGKQFRNFDSANELIHNSQNDYDPDLYEDHNCSYDQNGNLTSQVVTATGSVFSVAYYAYDSENRLTSFTSATSVVQFTYDGSGNLVSKTDNGATTHFVLDYADSLKRPLMETTTNGTPTRYYVWAGQQLLSIIETNGGVYYTHFDEMGNLLALSDTNGTVVAEFAYTPFGQDAGTTGSVEAPFRFMGAYGVRAIGENLYLTKYRAYDANLMRFLQNDPKGLNGGFNLYAYANNNPLYWLDFLGLEPWYKKAFNYVANKTESWYNNTLNSNYKYQQSYNNYVQQHPAAHAAAETFHKAAFAATLIMPAARPMAVARPAGLAAREVGTTALSPYRRTVAGETFQHYGYAEHAASFESGIRAGGFGTKIEGLSGSQARGGLSLDATRPLPNAVYTIRPEPSTLIRANPVVEAQFGQRGGLSEVEFIFGTGPGTVSGPRPIR